MLKHFSRETVPLGPGPTYVPLCPILKPLFSWDCPCRFWTYVTLSPMLKHFSRETVPLGPGPMSPCAPYWNQFSRETVPEGPGPMSPCDPYWNHFSCETVPVIPGPLSPCDPCWNPFSRETVPVGTGPMSPCDPCWNPLFRETVPVGPGRSPQVVRVVRLLDLRRPKQCCRQDGWMVFLISKPAQAGGGAVSVRLTRRHTMYLGLPTGI